MTAKALQHIVSFGFVDLVVRIKGFQICSGGDHLKISIEAWLRSILLPSFGLCLYALGEGDDVDLSVRGLLRDASQVNPKDTDAAIQALELARLFAIEHEFNKSVVGKAVLASSTCLLQASAKETIAI